jgi:hypothetical protein
MIRIIEFMVVIAGVVFIGCEQVRRISGSVSVGMFRG